MWLKVVVACPDTNEGGHLAEVLGGTMHVHVRCDRDIPLGQVGIEDIYDGPVVAGVVFHFHEEDLGKSCREELGEMLNRQAKAWVERVAAPSGRWHPVEVRALYDHHLPPGVEVIIEDSDDCVTYLFAPDAIDDRARIAFERTMQGRVPTWCRVGVPA